MDEEPVTVEEEFPDENVMRQTNHESLPPRSFGLYEYYYIGTRLLQIYGWYLLFAGLAAWYLYSKYVKPRLSLLTQQAASARVKKTDVGQYVKRQEAMEAARFRLQQDYELKAARVKEEQKQKEEAHRQELIDDWERHKQGQGYRSKTHFDEKPDEPGSSNLAKHKPKSSLRDDDNFPLMGGGGGTSYRAPKKGCPGGSCGKGGGCG